jgi:ribosome maturation factor RimP
MKIDVVRLKDKMQTVTESLGFELADLVAPIFGGRLILRVFIHSSKGVTLDDCANVSRALSDMLDTDDPIPSRYTLEVSSLGLDRPLVSAKDFMRRIGEQVKVSYKTGDGEKTIEGSLIFSDENDIKIETGDENITIPVDANPGGKIIIQ